MTDDEKLQLMHTFAEAWNAHDIDAIMSCMTDDCVFEASGGPDVCGARSVGWQEVRAEFSQVLAAFPDAQWRGARHFSIGDRGVSEWTLTGTRIDGTRIEVNGCDLLTFQGGRIAVKNSYRKNRLQAAA
jgi:ketosteroid isomerase-like protein